MNLEEKNITETESIQLITSMIKKAQNRFSESGILYIFWGWLILICCVVQFIALYFFNNQNAYYIWYVTLLAQIYQVFYLRKKGEKKTVRTYTDGIAGFVWLVFIICITLLIIIMIHLKAYTGIFSAVLVMYGMPTFLSGVILKFNPLKIGGICCWLLAIVSLFVMYEFQLLLIATAIIVAWMIPGYLLKAKFKKEN
jgi:hypothetical protein